MKGVQRFLAISGLLFVATGLVMGLSTPFQLNRLFGLFVQTRDLHIFRAMMGVYIALGILLFYGFVSEAHARIVLNVEMVVVTGLVAGRSYSLLVDGYYHWTSCLMLIVDIVLFTFCMFFLFKTMPKSE